MQPRVPPAQPQTRSSAHPTGPVAPAANPREVRPPPAAPGSGNAARCDASQLVARLGLQLRRPSRRPAEQVPGLPVAESGARLARLRAMALALRRDRAQRAGRGAASADLTLDLVRKIQKWKSKAVRTLEVSLATPSCRSMFIVPRSCCCPWPEAGAKTGCGTFMCNVAVARWGGDVGSVREGRGGRPDERRRIARPRPWARPLKGGMLFKQRCGKCYVLLPYARWAACRPTSGRSPSVAPG